MKINRIEIDAFGKFNKFVIDLSGGFQIIHGGNEDGKTTLMDFIKLILYSKAENARSLQNPRRKYAPFSGRPSAGAIFVERGGTQFVIQKSIGDTPGKDRARIINIKTGREELSKNQETGQWFTGLDAEGFEQICFVENIGKMDAPVGANAEEQTIANLTGAGDKRVSRQVIIKRLTDAKEALVSKSGKLGGLVDMRAKLEQLKADKYQTDAAYQKQASLTAEYNALLKRYEEQRRLSVLTDSIRVRDSTVKTDKLLAMIKDRSKNQAVLSRSNIPAERVGEYVDRLGQASDEYFNAKKIIEEWNSGEVGNDGVPMMLDEDIRQFEAMEQRIKGLESEIEALPKKNPSLPGLPPAVYIPLMILIAGAAAVLSLFFGPWYLLTLILLFFVFIGIKKSDPETEAKRGAYEKQIGVVRAQTLQILQKYECENKAQLRERFIAWKSYSKNIETQKRLEAKLSTGRQRFVALAELYEPVKTPNEAQELLEKLTSAVAGIEILNAGIRDLARELGLSTENPSEISARLAAMKIKASAAPRAVDSEDVIQRWNGIKDEDISAQLLELQKKLITPNFTPDQLDDEIKAVSQEASDMALYYKALETAAEVMNEAADELRAGFGAELNRRAGLILSELTNGQYTDILIAKDYSISIKSDAQYREYEYFSSGAIDQAYLALRLALSEITAGQGEPLPLLLDDSLMQYDDDRLLCALKYLSRRTGQTILFTCHRHILEAARGLGTRIASIHDSRPV